MNKVNEILKMRKMFNKEITHEFEVEISTRINKGKTVDVIVAANDDTFLVSYHRTPSARNSAKEYKSQHQRIKKKLKKRA